MGTGAGVLQQPAAPHTSPDAGLGNNKDTSVSTCAHKHSTHGDEPRTLSVGRFSQPCSVIFAAQVFGVFV